MKIEVEKEVGRRSDWEEGDANLVVLDLREEFETYLDKALFSMAVDVKERRGKVAKLENGVFEGEPMYIEGFEIVHNDSQEDDVGEPIR